MIDDRAQTRSTLIASQVPVGEWDRLLADPTVADVVLDRLVHNAVRTDLKGDSMRKKKGGGGVQENDKQATLEG